MGGVHADGKGFVGDAKGENGEERELFFSKMRRIGTAHEKMAKVDKKGGDDDGGHAHLIIDHIDGDKLRGTSVYDGGHEPHEPSGEPDVFCHDA